MNPSAEQAKLEVMKIHGDAYADLRGSWWVICRPNGDDLSRNWDCLSKLEQKNTEDEAWDEALFHLNPPAPRGEEAEPDYSCSFTASGEHAPSLMGDCLYCGSKGRPHTMRPTAPLPPSEAPKPCHCGTNRCIGVERLLSGFQCVRDAGLAAMRTRIASEAPKGDELDRDWIEDFGHENGKYQNKCCICSLPFLGHKRRPICKNCCGDVPLPGISSYWISVKDRLPEPGENVLAISVSAYSTSQHYTVYRTEPLVEDGLWTWRDSHSGRQEGWYTHWMPLPAPPNGGTE